MLPLSQANTVVILSLVATTLLLLRNNHISLYQSSNFVWSPSNHLGSRTILFEILACAFSLYTAGASAVNISSVSSIAGSMLLFDILPSVILSDPNISSSILIAFGFCCTVLSVYGFYHDHLVLTFVLVCGLMPQSFVSFWWFLLYCWVA